MELVRRLKEKMKLLGSTIAPNFDSGLLCELERVNRMLDAGEPIGAVLDAFEPTFAKILTAIGPDGPSPAAVYDDADNSDRLIRRVQRHLEREIRSGGLVDDGVFIYTGETVD